MSAHRDLNPPPGNPARPVYLLLAACIGTMLLAFPVARDLLGLGAAAIVSITLLILAMGIGMLAFTRHLARGYTRDQADLELVEVWADWFLPVDQHRPFVTAECRS